MGDITAITLVKNRKYFLGGLPNCFFFHSMLSPMNRLCYHIHISNTMAKKKTFYIFYTVFKYLLSSFNSILAHEAGIIYHSLVLFIYHEYPDMCCLLHLHTFFMLIHILLPVSFHTKAGLPRPWQHQRTWHSEDQVRTHAQPWSSFPHIHLTDIDIQEQKEPPCWAPFNNRGTCDNVVPK